MPSQNRALKPDKTTFQNLASGPLSYTTNYGRRVKIEKVLIKSSVPITESVTISLDSLNGTNYDSVLKQDDLSSEQSYVYTPDGDLNLQLGDEIKIQCTNANLTGTVYVVVKASELTQ